MMDKDFLVKLTNDLYRITLLFPKKDPLRYKIRNLGTEILAQLVIPPEKNPISSEDLKEEFFLRLENNLTVLNSYLEVAKVQNWVSPKEIFEIKNQYGRIKEELGFSAIPKKASEEAFEVEPRKVVEVQEMLKPRQKKVLEILAKQERAQVKDLKREFPNTSKRTLRRDLKDLLNQDIIERIGNKSDTFYKIK